MSNPNTLVSQFAEDAEVFVPATTQVADLSVLVSRALELDRLIAELEDRLKPLYAERKQVREFTIPDMMRGMGTTRFDGHGAVVKLIEDVACSFPKDPERRHKAIQWLRDNGHGDIIKNEVSFTLPKGSDADVEKLLKAVYKSGAHITDVDRGESVHTQTLKALIREQLKRGRPIDFDLLGAYLYARVTIEVKEKEP